MSYPEPPPEQTGPGPQEPSHDLEIDLAAFLPEGVELGEPGAAPDAGADTEGLSQVERDLDAVDAAIAALDAGTYGIHPTTGEPISDALLAEDPTRLS